MSEVLDLWGWECLCKCIGNHFFDWAIDKPKRAVFNDPANEMKSDINMFGSSVILMIFGVE